MNMHVHVVLRWSTGLLAFIVLTLLCGLAQARAPECGVEALALDDKLESSRVKQMLCDHKSDAVALQLMKGTPAARAIARQLLQNPSAAASPRRLSAECQQALEQLIRPKYETLQSTTDIEEFAAISPIFEPDEFAQLSGTCQPFTPPEWASFRAKQTYLITALLRPGDMVTLVEDNPSSPNTVPEQPLVILDQYGGGEVWLFARTAGVDATAFVTQSDADVIWTHQFSHPDHSGLHWRQTTCVDINLRIDAGRDKRGVLFDGQLVNHRLIWEQDQKQSNYHRALGTLHVPLPPAAGINHVHELDVVSLQRSKDEQTSLWKGEVAVDMPAPEAAEQCVDAQLPDLRGRYALTRVSVSGDCESVGVLPTQVRAYVQQFAQGRKLSLAQTLEHPGVLDAVESLERSDDPRVSRQSVRSLASLADRFEAHGVNKLLTIDVHCTAADQSARVLARTIDITKLGEQIAENPDATAVDMANVLKSFAVPVPDRRRLEDGMEVALGMTLDQSAVALEQPNSYVDYSTPRRTRRTLHLHGIVDAADDFRIDYQVVSPSNPKTEVEVGVALFVDPYLANRFCREIAAAAKLATVEVGIPAEISGLSDVAAGLRYEQADAVVGMKVVYFREGEPSELGSPLALPVGRVGRYMVWVRDKAGGSYSAACFEIERRDWMVAMQIGGMLSSRRFPWFSGSKHEDADDSQGDVREGDYKTFCENSSANCTYNTGKARDFVNHYDVKLRVTDTFGHTEFGQVGAMVGYSYTETLVRHDEDDDNQYDDNDVTPRWHRRGMLIGGVLGAELPLTGCSGYRTTYKRGLETFAKRCTNRWLRAFSLGWLNTLSLNFGVFSLSSSPWANQRSRPDFAADLSSQVLLRVQVNSVASLYAFYEVTMHDLGGWFTNFGKSTSFGDTYDIRNALGVGFSVHLRVYKPTG